MKLSEKINFLEKLLNQPKQNHADTFKQDILIYFNEDFSAENQQLNFLNNLNSKKEVENLIESLTSRFVLKFDPNCESESDFIHNHLMDGYT